MNLLNHDSLVLFLLLIDANIFHHIQKLILIQEDKYLVPSYQ
jgi:hypothetical protein